MKTVFTILTFALFAFANPAKADRAQSNDFQQFKQQAECRIISKGAAMNRVARSVKGKVLSASLNKRSNPPIYRVKVISKSGRVKTVRVNACSGRMMG